MQLTHLEIDTSHGVIRGMLHMPETKDPKAVIVIAHGYFSANRVGPARLHVQIAKALSTHGFAVIRADFLGVGESDGEFSDISFDTELRDLEAICDFALITFPDIPLVLLGHSMGGNLSLQVATNKKEVKKVILIAPDVEKLGGIDQLFSKEKLEQLSTMGWTLRKGLHINASFIDEIRSTHPLDLARDLHIPIIIVQGDKDELYSLDGAKNLEKASSFGKLHIVSNGDHNFLTPQARSILLELLPKLLQNTV